MEAYSPEPIERLISELQVDDSEDQLIIGLDFGTTFSGVAYTFRDKKKVDIISIVDWPCLETVTQPKVPTIISYDPNDKASFTWGEKARVQREDSKVEGFKLLLDPEQENSLYVPELNTKAELRKLGKPPLDVAADYLGALYKHAMSRIESKVVIEYLDLCQKKFVLSVPAVWSDKALDITMRAAKKAGIYPVTLIKEPEAAALYTLYDLQNRGLHVGDALVICDAGGGTVDLISYEISSMVPSLQVKELVSPKGGMAGSLMLNKRFEEKFKSLIGEDQYRDVRETSGYSDAVSFFDRTVKTSFRDEPDERWYVNFPGAGLEDSPENGIKNDTWLLKSETVKEIFNPLINNIKDMIDDQVKSIRLKRLLDGYESAEKVKAILLVGGFGSSEFLKRTIQDAHQDIQVIQPHDAWSAIVKGAVLSQLPQEALVISSVAPRYYGVAAVHDFDEWHDKGQAKFLDECTGKWRVTKMIWYILKNEDLKRDQKIKFNFYRRLRENYTDDQLIFHNELITDDNNRSTAYPKAGVTKTNCTLKADLRNVDRSSFKKRLGVNGTWYVDVFYDLIVAIKSAQMKFSLEIKGEELGAVDANYD